MLREGTIARHPRFKEFQTWMMENKGGARPCPAGVFPKQLPVLARGRALVIHNFKEKPTGHNRTIAGVVFLSWHVGICRYEWRSEDGRLVITETWKLTAAVAYVDGEPILGSNQKTKRFRSRHNAAAAAVAMLKKGEKQ
jgi:hypothetical protein